MTSISRNSAPTASTAPKAAADTSSASASSSSDSDFSKVVADTVVSLASKSIMNKIKELSSDTFQSAE